MKERRNYKVGILSLGCPRNLVDSESILARLKRSGHRIVEMERAEVGLVNTCAFIEEARAESVEAILELVDLKKKGRLKKIIVYGCLAQRYKERLRRELPEVDAFVGRVSLNHEAESYRLTPGHYAYLKICEGCINRCSYCAIPGIKGKFASLDIQAVLDKVRRLDSEKTREINIVGQDITGYGLDLYRRAKLAELLKKISSAAKNISWIRLLYLYPSRVSDELLEVIKDEPRLCKYIDLPLQHINRRILKLMRRQTTPGDIRKLISKIRKKLPGAAIRTSLIVGFPSETDQEFRELMDFIQEVQFERLGAFVYSREEGTAAWSLKGQVAEKVKRERFSALMSKQQEIAALVNARFLGREMDVLIDSEESGAYLARSEYDAPEVDGMVYLNSKKRLAPGDMVRARITDTLEYDLVAEA